VTESLSGASIPRRRGRRPSGEDTRGAILTAARGEFASRGYDGTTMRGIARQAGVDARLVHHYFDGGKEEIFVAALDFPVRPQDVVDAILLPGPDGVGERLVRMFLGIWDTPEGRVRMRAIFGAVAVNEAGARMIREFITRELLGRLAERLAVDRPALRATLAASHLVGIAMARIVLQVEPLASASIDEIAEFVAPTIQRYLTGADPAVA
jgi:AcrR family transcriptional regulator